MRLNNLTLYILFATCFALPGFLKGQTLLGLQHSNLGGIHQVGLNPANIANSRHKMYFNGLTAGFGFNNDYLKLNLPFSFINLMTGNVPSQYKNSSGSLKFEDAWLVENVNNKPKNMNLYLQTRTPGFMMTLSKGWALGFQYKNTFSFQVNDVAEPLARFARYGVDSASGTVTYSGPNQFKIGETFGDNAFTINLNTYGEIGVTLAKTIIKDEHLVIKAGITPKILLGYASGYIKNRGLQIVAAGTDTIGFGETDVEYGYTDPGNFPDLNSINVDFLQSKLMGSGFGYDIGAAFEYKPAAGKIMINKKNNYLFRGGISLMDAGHITYKQKMKNTHITNTGGTKYVVITPEFAKAWGEGEERGLQFTDSTLRTVFSIDTSSKTVVSKMPTTLNLQFDFNVFKLFYVGANFSQDLRGKQNIGIRKPSYIVLIPRMESRFVELAMPIGMMNDYRNLRVGFYLRVGPAFVGSDNLIGQLKSNNVNGVDLYFGISAGITRKKDKEKEEDKVSFVY